MIFRLVIPFGVTGVNAPGFQLCQQAVARVVITYATNKINLRPQPCRRNRCRRRWPATNFRSILATYLPLSVGNPST